MGPAVVARASVPADRGARNATGSASAVADGQQPDKDPILSDPNEAYRTEVLHALKDAMLAHSSSLGIGPNEWLTDCGEGQRRSPPARAGGYRLEHAHHPLARTRIWESSSPDGSRVKKR